MRCREFKVGGIEYWCDADTGLLYKRVNSGEPEEIGPFEFADAASNITGDIFVKAMFDKIAELAEEIDELRKK